MLVLKLFAKLSNWYFKQAKPRSLSQLPFQIFLITKQKNSTIILEKNCINQLHVNKILKASFKLLAGTHIDTSLLLFILCTRTHTALSSNTFISTRVCLLHNAKQQSTIQPVVNTWPSFGADVCACRERDIASAFVCSVIYITSWWVT